MLAEIILELEGCEVLTASNAQQALTHIAGGAQIDVVLTDIIMPRVMNGIGLGERINDHDPRIKVLYTS